MNPDKLLTLLMGKCWHDWKRTTASMSPVLIYKCGVCGKLAGPLGEPDELPVNPSFSDPHHRDEFFTWLCKERGEMWRYFQDWVYDCWEDAVDIVERGLSWNTEADRVAWLFFSSPSRPRDLMAEWLRLEEVREKWGWEKCPTCWRPGDYTGPLPMFCPSCNGSGKIRAEWAREGREGK